MRLPQIKTSPYRYVTLPAQGMLCLPPNTRYPPINKSCLYTRTRNCFRFVGFTRPFLQSEGLIYIIYFGA